MLSYSQILEVAGNLIYVALGLAALYGVFLVVLLIRRIAQKRFASAAAEAQFVETVRDYLQRGDLTGLVQYCDTPELWNKAAPQLVLVAVANAERTPAKIKLALAEKFERDILSEIEFRTSWVATIVKSAPMLGLLGTVIGMISAFDQISQMKQTGMDATSLAKDISFALFTTAIGLAVAIPLVLAGAAIHVRIGKLQDSVQLTIGEILDAWERSPVAQGRAS